MQANRPSRVRLAAGLLALLVASPAVFAAPRSPGLKIGLMPALNSVPLIVAEHLGLFAAEGLDVELILFQSQLDRETALQTGQIDGTVSDLINAIGARANGFDLRVTSLTEGDFLLLTAPGSRLRTLDDWKDPAVTRVPTGLLANSIVFYVTERMLERGGVDPAKVELVPILQLPARLEMLLAGRIEAACLPEPLATVALLRGAHRVADTSSLEAPPGVLLFRGAALREKADSIRRLYRACDRAVEALNREPDRYRDVIVRRGGFPPEVRDRLRLPRFGRSALPPEALVRDVAGWMAAKGLITHLPAYGEIVAPGFLP